MINVLVFSGIFNYILLKKLKQSVMCGKIFCGIVDDNLNSNFVFNECDVEICRFKTLAECCDFAVKNNINLVIVLDGLFIEAGAVDFFKHKTRIPVAGITKYWKFMESSKRFGKKIMVCGGLLSPDYQINYDMSDLNKSLSDFGLPLVIKEDGYKKGFGTYILNTETECKILAKKLLKKNDFFIAEKYISGKEVTLQLIWDGKSLIPLAPVRDYKRLKNGNKGINTGSMGSYIPVLLTDFQNNMVHDYIKKLENFFYINNADFRGIFALDLMFTSDKVYNLEFNMRPCSPEFEVFLEHTDNDILKLFYDMATGNCSGFKLNYKSGITGCVNIMYKNFEKNISKTLIKEIKVNDEFLCCKDNLIINSNIRNTGRKGVYSAKTDRPIFSVIKHDNINPFPEIYEHINKISGKNLYFRTDIGR